MLTCAVSACMSACMCVYICVCLYMCALCGDTKVRGEVYGPPRANRPPRAGVPPQQCAWVLRREEASPASQVVLLETDDGDVGIFHQEKS